MMQAIAWDNAPKDYFDDLKAYLLPLGINMTLMQTEHELVASLSQNPDQWDLVITDLIDEDTEDGAQDPDAGSRIGKFARKFDKPVYIVTKARDVDPVTVPEHVLVLSKFNPAVYSADYIRRDLTQRGLFYLRTQVALIYGHDLDSNLKLKAFLSDSPPKGCGLSVAVLNPETFKGDLLDQVRSNILTSGAVIAVCTADDRVKTRDDEKDEEKHRQPRQNVLLEIGMVLGINDGKRRLITVQQWGKEPKRQAHLPSDRRMVEPQV